MVILVLKSAAHVNLGFLFNKLSVAATNAQSSSKSANQARLYVNFPV